MSLNPGYGTVSWLDQTFKTRARAEELLRPELENGVISQHDYELATRFLPGYHRYYPYMDGAGMTLLTASYGYYRRPRWSQPRLLALSSGAYIVGAFFGQLRRASAHLQFVKSLDDRTRFFQALQNVQNRLGGESTLDWIGVPAGAAAPRGPPADVHGDVPQPIEGDAAWTAAEPLTQASGASVAAPAAPIPTPQVAQHAKSRWDEIRMANARSAQTSSWDALRQQHERSRNADNVRPEEGGRDASVSDPDAERAQEQARFDAILEAERKIAGG